jgi:hypothetical protein
MSFTWKTSPIIDQGSRFMRHPGSISLLAASLAAASFFALAAPAPNEENCRKAISEGLEMLRRQAPGNTPRDEADRQRLLAEMQALVESNRRQGISECQTWTQIMGKAFNQ